MMSVLCQRAASRPVLFVKGAPEAVLERCTQVGCSEEVTEPQSCTARGRIVDAETLDPDLTATEMEWMYPADRTAVQSSGRHDVTAKGVVLRSRNCVSFASLGGCFPIGL